MRGLGTSLLRVKHVVQSIQAEIDWHAPIAPGMDREAFLGFYEQGGEGQGQKSMGQGGEGKGFKSAGRRRAGAGSIMRM